MFFAIPWSARRRTSDPGLPSDLMRLSAIPFRIRQLFAAAPARSFGRRLAPWMLAGTGVLGLAQPVPAQEALALRLQTDLLPPNKDARVGTATFAMADRIEGQTDTDVTLTGSAELRRPGGEVLKADTMHYVLVEDELFAQGAVRIVRDGNIFDGPEMRVRLDDYSGYFLKPVFQLTGRPSNRAPRPVAIITSPNDPLYSFRNPTAPNRVGFPGRGDAERADFIDRDHVELDDVLYTTCRIGNDDWYIKAEHMALDQTSQTGVARNARIVFKGVPILASPYLSFPLDDSRKSGLLPPTLSVTSRSGVEFLQPYYFNLAPNYDFTLYPKLISARGLQLGGDARYLFPGVNGTTRAEGLMNDRRDEGRGRYALSTLNTFAQGSWSGYANVNKVSDDNYFVDYSRSVAVSSQRLLPRDIAVTYNQPYWYAMVRSLRYQTLQDPNAPIVPPFEKSPQILFHGARLDVLGGFDFSLDADATRFIHPSLAGGDRFMINPSVSYPIIRPGWYVTPKIEYSSTHYNLRDQPAGAQTDFSRNLPTGSVDAGMTFERDTSLLGRNLLQTLEPRLFYVRTPYRDQSMLPNYDSGLTDFNFAQLFAENPYGGYDRIADANAVTAAVTTRYIDAENGAEIFRASLGQRYYLTQQRVTLPGQAPIEGRNSDVIAEVSGEIYRRVVVDAGVQYSPIIRSVIRSNIGVSWRPEPTKVINAEYRYRQGDLEQVDVSAQWPILRNLYGVGRVNYSTRDRKIIEALAGFEYAGCCWVVRLVGSRYVTSTQTATSTLFLQLELNGLARLGSNPLESLKRNVPGYQLINPAPAGGSPYLNYQ